MPARGYEFYLGVFNSIANECRDIELNTGR